MVEADIIIDSIMNTYNRLPVTFVKGESVYLFDDNGKKYLDFLSGLGVVCLGHANSEIAEAVCKQMRELVHVSNLYSTKPQKILAGKISEISLKGRVFFANSGAEANEAAIKLARKYGKTNLNGAYEIISAKDSFHGRTLATLAATAQPEKQKHFTPMPDGFSYVEFNDIGAINAKVSDKTCAILLETIQGEGGINVVRSSYLQDVNELCRKKNLLLIIDEVQTGIGRTGEWFSYKHFGIEPDIITAAKGIANGLPIGALVAGPNVADVLQPGDHASTFGGGPVVCSAAIKVLEIIEENNILDKVKVVGDYFEEKLTGLIYSNLAKNVKGLGLMRAIILNHTNASKVVLSCLEKGLLVNNVKDDTIRFLPPLIIDEGMVDKAVNILEQSIREVG